MKKLLHHNLFFLFIAAIVMDAGSIQAQEFRGFYSTNNKINYRQNAGSYYKQEYKKKYIRARAGNVANVYASNRPYFTPVISYQPFQGFYGPVSPPINITIQVIPSGSAYARTITNYDERNDIYSRRNSFRDYRFTDGQFNNRYNEIPIGNRIVRINGNRFYEINGNYYRVDDFENVRGINPSLYRLGRNNYYIEEEDYRDGNDMYNSDRRRSSNVAYLDNEKQIQKKFYLANNYRDENVEYTTKKQQDDNDFTLQQELETLKAEKEAWKKRENERAEEYKEATKAERQKQNQELKEKEAKSNNELKANKEELKQQQKEKVTGEAKEAEIELNEIRKQNAKEIEKARLKQKTFNDKQLKAQQKANKEEEKRPREVAKNRVSNEDLFSNLNVGTTVDEIPKNSKKITIDGKKTYISPSNIYYRKQGSRYIIVGMH